MTILKQALEENLTQVTNCIKIFKGKNEERTGLQGQKLTPEQEEAVKAILDEKSGAIIESFVWMKNLVREHISHQNERRPASTLSEPVFTGIMKEAANSSKHGQKWGRIEYKRQCCESLEMWNPELK